MSDLLRIFFPLEQDDDEYPPASVETMWARATNVSGEYVIENIPIFAKSATVGDVISVRRDAEGLCWLGSVVQKSKNSLIRVIMLERGLLPVVIGELQRLGCDLEHSNEFNVLAVSIPPEAELAAVQRYLQHEESAGRLGYEEPILWNT